MWRIFTILGLALSIGIGTAFAQDGQTKKDSSAKQRPSAEDWFKARDKDHDGKLTLQEFIGNAKSDSDQAKRLTERFKAIDTKANGYITLDELKAARAKHAEQAGKHHNKKPPQKDDSTTAT